MSSFSKADVTALAREWCPPAIRRLLSRSATRFEGPFSNWAEAAAVAGDGYAASDILLTVRAAAKAVQGGIAEFERDGVTFGERDYVWPVAACLLRAAALEGGKLRVIDFGGSLGSTFIQHRHLFSGLHDLRWSVVEQAHFVDCGRREFATKQLHFYRSVDECMSAAAHDVALLSSVIQYLPRPDSIVQELHAAGIKYLIVARTPVTDGITDQYYVQRVDAAIYRAKYPIRVFTRDSLARCCHPYVPLLDFLSPVDRHDPFAQIGRLLQRTTAGVG